MSSFEKEYYESDQFWRGEMLQDSANKERIKTTASMIPAGTKSLADIGCGNGIFINYLRETREDLDLMGVDRSAMALKYVRAKKTVADIVELPFADREFDCVTCLEVIEHLPIPSYSKALSELARISGKNIIISVPFAEKLEDSYTKCPSCKTIFNKEIHLRSFKETDMQELLTDHGFKCSMTRKLNPMSTFLGHSMYRKLFYPEQFSQWDSPICPLCGYKSKDNASNPEPAAANGSGQRKLVSYLSALPKLLWPKKVHYYWILASYSRL